MLAYALARGGRRDESRERLDEVQARPNEYVWPMGLAFAYAHLGDADVALDHPENAYDDRVGWMSFIGREPALDVLRHHPRFKRILRRIGPESAIAGSAPGDGQNNRPLRK